MNFVNGRIRNLEIDVNHMLLEWGNRYRYAMASAELLDAYEKKKETLLRKGVRKDKKALQLISSNTLEGLKMTILQSNHFVLADHISQGAEFFTEFDNQPAVIERERMLNKLLVDNGMDPYLLKLSRDEALKAGNLLSTMLLQYAGEDKIEKLMDGSMKLEKIPQLKKMIKGFITRSTTAEISRRELVPIQMRRSSV